MKSKYLTMDINIVYSMINMKLRDNYSSFSNFCEDEDIEKDELLKRLSDANIEYDENKNQLYYK